MRTVLRGESSTSKPRFIRKLCCDKKACNALCVTSKPSHVQSNSEARDGHPLVCHDSLAAVKHFAISGAQLQQLAAITLRFTRGVFFEAPLSCSVEGATRVSVGRDSELGKHVFRELVFGRHAHAIFTASHKTIRTRAASHKLRFTIRLQQSSAVLAEGR